MNLNLPAHYFDLLPLIIEQTGFPSLPILSLVNGELIQMQPHEMDAGQILDYVFRIMAQKEITEIVFALDRMTKPGQGTKYADVLTLYWWHEPYPNDLGWRFGVINYRLEATPQLIEPIDWNNMFWHKIMYSGIERRYNAIVQNIVNFTNKAGLNKEEMIDLLRKKGASEHQIAACIAILPH